MGADLLNTYPPFVIGRLAVATGIVGFAGMILAVLTFAFGRTFGRLEDVLVTVAALLSAGLAMLLLPQHRIHQPEAAPVAFGLALFGAFLTAFGSVLAATEATSWFLAQLYVATGTGLLGVWLLLLSYSAGIFHDYPNGVITIGVLGGAVMALGMAAIPGILANAQSERSAPWISRYVGRAGLLGWQVIYPLWCIWLGQSLLRL